MRARNEAPGAVDDSDEDGHLQRGFAHYEARQRQLAAVLMAHGVPVTFAHCSGDPAGQL